MNASATTDGLDACLEKADESEQLQKRVVSLS